MRNVLAHASNSNGKGEKGKGGKGPKRDQSLLVTDAKGGGKSKGFARGLPMGKGRGREVMERIDIPYIHGLQQGMRSHMIARA